MSQAKPIIFVVDDDPSVRKALRRLFHSAGYGVETFPSAQDFLDRSECTCPAVLILDLKMPGMSGLELQHHLKSTGKTIPVVILTAQDDEEVRQASLHAGAVGFIRKPVQSNVLLDAVRVATESATHSRE